MKRTSALTFRLIGVNNAKPSTPANIDGASPSPHINRKNSHTGPYSTLETDEAKTLHDKGDLDAECPFAPSGAMVCLFRRHPSKE